MNDFKLNFDDEDIKSYSSSSKIDLSELNDDGHGYETKNSLSGKYPESDYLLVNKVTDWYINTTYFNESFIVPGNIKISKKPILIEYAKILYSELKKAIQEKNKTVDNYDYREISLKINLPNIDELVIFRGNKIKSIEGDIWALRRVRGKVPDLNSIGLKKALVDLLTNENLTSGLILFVGETGNGKSTTCAAVIKKLCETRGLFALTIEDPPELPLHGQIGEEGFCIQTEARMNEFSEAIRSAMRSYPAANGSILYVGEVRDSETAQEIIKVSANGHLVVTTIHGDDVLSGLKRLVDYASNSNTKSSSSSSDIRKMLASSLRIVIHQKLKTLPITDNVKNKIQDKVLTADFILSNGIACPIGNALINDKLEQNYNNIHSRQNLVLESKGIEQLIKDFFIMEN